METWALPGIPDLLVFDELGKFHFIELKHTTNNKVELRPHQVAWLSKHDKGSCWIWVRQKKRSMKKAKVYIYHARQVVDLRLDGLSVEPVYECEDPFGFETIFNLTFPYK
jgi:hypothetical protein